MMHNVKCGVTTADRHCLLPQASRGDRRNGAEVHSRKCSETELGKIITVSEK